MIYLHSSELLKIRFLEIVFSFSKSFLKKIEFELTLFFLIHWHKLIYKEIEFCSNSGFYTLLQRTTLYFLSNSQYWPREFIDEMRRRRLVYLLRKNIIARNYLSNLGFNIGKNTTINFSQIPIMSRENLRVYFSEAIERNKDTKKLYIGSTSGTSGIPMRIAVTHRFAVHYRIVRKRLFGFAGLKPSDEFLYPRTTLNPHFCIKNMFIARDLQSLVSSWRVLFEKIKEQKIKALYAFPSFLLLLARQTEKFKIVPPHLVALIVAGEDLTAGMRKSIEIAFSTKVYNFYASVELSSIGQECEYQNGLHINEEFIFVEIVSQEDNPLGINRWGRVVITLYDFDLVPIIRYDTGDFGILLADSCTCGRTLTRLKIRGRSSDMIEIDTGVISPHAFKEILDAYDEKNVKISRYQIIVEGKKIILLIVPTIMFTDRDREKIASICKEFLKNQIDFEIRIGESVEYVGLKAPFLLKKRDNH